MHTFDLFCFYYHYYYLFFLGTLSGLMLLIHFSCFYQMVSMGRRRFGTDFQLMFRILKALLFLGFMSVMTVLFVVCGLTISDLFAAIIAFLPTGWALLLVSQIFSVVSARSAFRFFFSRTSNV
jgi:callose synthase